MKGIYKFTNNINGKCYIGQHGKTFLFIKKELKNGI